MVLFAFLYLFSACSLKISSFSKTSSFSMLFHKLSPQQDQKKLGLCFSHALFYFLCYLFYNSVAKINFFFFQEALTPFSCTVIWCENYKAVDSM
jgi:hypothetical protein